MQGRPFRPDVWPPCRRRACGALASLARARAQSPRAEAGEGGPTPPPVAGFVPRIVSLPRAPVDGDRLRQLTRDLSPIVGSVSLAGLTADRRTRYASTWFEVSGRGDSSARGRLASRHAQRAVLAIGQHDRQSDR